MPHGESLADALRRYAGALRRLPGRAGSVTLVVTHELALRHIAAATAPGSQLWPDTELGHAVPYLFDSRAVRRAAVGLAANATPPPVNGKPHGPGGDAKQAALRRIGERQ